MKTQVYNDPTYESSMKQRLEQSRLKMQALLIAWNATGLQACETSAQLYELAWNPDIAWNEGILKFKAEPEGLTEQQVKDYQDRLVEPDSHAFFAASAICSQDPYCLREQLAFEIKGDMVVLAPGSQNLIKAHSVFADSKHREKVGRDILNLIKTYNALNEVCGGQLGQMISGQERVLINPEILQNIILRT